MTVVIDHQGFPHIIELILSHATPGTRAIFSATSRKYRDNMKATMRLVRLRTDFDFSETMPAPLFSDTLNNPLPFIPGLVQAIDLLGFHWNYSDRRRVRREYRDKLTSLGKIRRFRTATPPSPDTWKKNRVRLPNVHTLVDYINVNMLTYWSDDHPRLELHSCFHRHILHLQWDDDHLLPDLPIISTKFAHWILDRIVVLWPEPIDKSAFEPSRASHRLQHCLDVFVPRKPKKVTIVGPEWLKGSISGEWRYISHEEWWEELGDDKELIGKWVDAPEESK